MDPGVREMREPWSLVPAFAGTTALRPDHRPLTIGVPRFLL